MSESELAKYNLLSILTIWRLSQPIKNETDLDKSISYLEQMVMMPFWLAAIT